MRRQMNIRRRSDAFIASRVAEPRLEDFLRQLDEFNDLLNLR